jgi:hypothetical protein
MHSVNLAPRGPRSGRQRLTLLGWAVAALLSLIAWAGIVLAVRWLLRLSPEVLLQVSAGALLLVAGAILGRALLELDWAPPAPDDVDEAER